jgi:AcrR family transcriptional regulator
MTEKRRYELKKRAEQLAETRRRITEATVELHRTVGPAGTRINEIAGRAGAQCMTVYNHFPDESSLLTACSARWRALHPSPDLALWRAIGAAWLSSAPPPSRRDWSGPYASPTGLTSIG